MRNPQAGLIRNDVSRNVYVWGALALCLGLIGMAVGLPALADLLGLPWPGLQGLALAGAASLVPLVLGQVWLALIRPGVA